MAAGLASLHRGGGRYAGSEIWWCCRWIEEDDCRHSRIVAPFPLRLDARYRPPWRMLLVSFGTGCILLALEVIWFRFLRLYVASSPTAFAIMLAVVLAGIGFGGIVAWRNSSSPARPNQLLPVLLLLARRLWCFCHICFSGRVCQTRRRAFDWLWCADRVVCLALMFPVAFLSGILFPTIAASAGECGRPDEQHRDHDLVQYGGSSSRSAACKFRAVAEHRLSMESRSALSLTLCWACS